MKVRTCCLDEIALAFNALTNHNPGLAASRQHHNKLVIMFYNSKNTLKKLCFVVYHFGAIYIKKASIESILFREAWRYQLVQDPKVSLQSNVIEVLYFFIFQSFHFHPTNFVCYHAIKWSIFDLKGRFFDENMIEFNEEHVGMLRFAIHISLDCFQISIPLFLVGWHAKVFWCY